MSHSEHTEVAGTKAGRTAALSRRAPLADGSALDWAQRTVKLDNGFLCVVVDLARPRVTSLRLDPTGRGCYSPNQLATGLAPRDAGGTAPWNGALTQYVDGEGELHSSTDGGSVSVVDADRIVSSSLHAGATPYARLTEVELIGIELGRKVESWLIRLDGPRIEWRIRERWIADEVVTDCRTPILWFSQRDDWGEPFHHQLLTPDVALDDPYGNSRATLVSGGHGASRTIHRSPGAWVVAPTYARSADCNLRLEASASLQRLAVLNWWSALGQTRISADARPHETRVTAGDEGEFVFSVELHPDPVGRTMHLEPAERREFRLARRLFETQANCAMVANVRDGLFGNQPDGYHAGMCSWLHARTLLFSSAAAPAGGGAVWDPTSILRSQLSYMAASLDGQGRVTAGYSAVTALDVNPSFLLTAHDYAVASGDADHLRHLLPQLRRALASSLETAARTGGILSKVTSKDGSESATDYWDWLCREGAIAYPNILLWLALQAQSSIEAWLGDDRRASHYDREARSLRRRFVRIFWDDEADALAEAVADGSRSSHLYTAVQYLAASTGLLTGVRGRRVLQAIDRALVKLPATWQEPPARQTNLRDASELAPPFDDPLLTSFGHAQNGGILLSWLYFEVGALVRAGRVDEAWRSLLRLLDRFDLTALLEGVNMWDAAGRPDSSRLEPCLGDVGLVATAIPRWFLGIEPRLDGLTLDPRPVPGLLPAAVAFDHLGASVRITIDSWTRRDRRIRAEVARPSVLRPRLAGRSLRNSTLFVNGEPRQTAEDGTLVLAPTGK